jgi:hypothetical protein
MDQQKPDSVSLLVWQNLSAGSLHRSRLHIAQDLRKHHVLTRLGLARQEIEGSSARLDSETTGQVEPERQESRNREAEVML